MVSINIQYYRTKIGELILGSFDSKLCILDFRYRKMRDAVDTRIKRGLNSEFVIQDDELLAATAKQVDEYLSGERQLFDIPIIMVGTDFQKQVWQELMNVKYGETASYLDIAKRINNEKAVRAVASANGANSLGFIIPCHRIIESNGGLGGYGGGIAVKKRILKIESDNALSLWR